MLRARWSGMVSRLLLIYAVVELAVIFALVSTIGWGWTLLALVGTFLLGWGIVAPMAGSHLIRRIGQLRAGLTDQRAAGDGALISLAALLVLVPGLVSTALGMLLLIPPVRSAVGPGLTARAVRTLQRQMPGLSYASAFRAQPHPASYPSGYHSNAGYGRGDYIDGEVIDVRDVDAPAPPQRFDGR